MGHLVIVIALLFNGFVLGLAIGDKTGFTQGFNKANSIITDQCTTVKQFKIDSTYYACEAKTW